MDNLSTTSWARKGSSIIFDKNCLGPYISSGSVIPLRIVLAWQNSLPSNPPVSDRTILISGLETVIETLEPHDAESFLTQRIRPLIIKLQNSWTDCGIVFGFSSHPNSFKETTLEEEIVFHRRDRKKVRLSEGLWDGSATVNMKRIIRDGERAGEEVVVGYYVARIS